MKVEFSFKMHAGSLAEMCNGQLWKTSSDPALLVYGLCTDSREADRYTAFVALHGERADGHNYIPDAIRAGCRCVICEQSTEEIEQAGVTAIVVKDTELALATLAESFRNSFGGKVVAVTGSVGKTTTKDMIWAVLNESFKTYRTAGNHNSLIGMPLSVTEIPKDSEWAVLELGMNHKGEIERLAVACKPDYGIITSIGSAHLENFNDREGICRAKLEILCGLKSGGTLLLNGDEPLLQNIGGKSYRTVYVSVEGRKADFSAKNIRVETEQTLFDVEWSGGVTLDLSIPVMGKHNVYAALFAFAIGTISGMSPEEIRTGLSRFEPASLHQTRTECSGVTIIEDCYNASPESMNAALDVLETYCAKTGKRGIAVLGDMLELGNESATLHRSVGAHLAGCGVDLLFTVGQGGNQIALGARQNGIPLSRISQNPDRGDLARTVDALRTAVRPGDAILVKASRALHAEDIGTALKAYLRSGDQQSHA